MAPYAPSTRTAIGTGWSAGSQVSANQAARRPERGRGPEAGEQTRRQARRADAIAECPPEQQELDPAGDSRGRRQSRCAPFRAEDEQPRQPKRRKPTEGSGEEHPDYRELERRAGIPERIEGGGVEATHRRGQEPDRRSGEDAPDIHRILATELAGLEECTHDHLTEGEEGHGRGHHEEGDATESGVEPGAEVGADLFGAPPRPRHRRELRGRNGHAEEADGHQVNGLGISDGRHRARGQQCGQQRIDESAHLDDATTHEGGHKVGQDGADVNRGSRHAEAKRWRQTPDGGPLHEDLQQAPRDARPRRRNRQFGHRAAGAEGQQCADDGKVPRDWRGVTQEEPAMAVEDAEAPGREYEESRTRKEDPDEQDGERTLVAGKPRGNQGHQQRGGDHADHHHTGHDERQESADGAGHAVGLGLVFLREQPGVDRDEGRRERAFAEKILEEIGNAKGGGERVRDA